jgi:hypothetical protein
MVIISSRLVAFFAWFSGYSKTARAVTVFPFIFVRSKEELVPWLVNHEKIHIRQQMELLFIGAVLLHVVEVMYGFIVLRLSWYETYLYCSIEQEAYRNQNNPDYLKNRKVFSQFYYLTNKRRFTHKNGVIDFL